MAGDQKVRYVTEMKRRHFLLSSLTLAAATAVRAEAKPWSARLLRGGFDGKVWWMGLAVTLAPKWKTYWRVPGDGGIAPQIDLSGTYYATSKIHYPLPHRFVDEAGMTIGYKEEVVFPISIEPNDATKPVNVVLKSFFGVCDVVCIPAKFDADLVLDGTRGDAPDQANISAWQARVPILSIEGPIIKASAVMKDGKPHLLLDLLDPVADIFVEGEPRHYYGKPSGTSGLVTLPIHGAKTLDELKGNRLRITMDAYGRGLEQSVTVV